MPDHDTLHRCGGTRRADGAHRSVSRNDPTAPRSHSIGSRAASHRGESSRAAGRRTHRQTSRSASARSTVAGSQTRSCVRP